MVAGIVEYFIKSHVQSLPSYVKDSIDFINKISPLTGLKDECILVTLDVESLYTSIPHVGGLAALAHYLGDRDTNEYPPTNFIIEFAEHVLTYNHFRFERMEHRWALHSLRVILTSIWVFLKNVLLIM